MYPYRASDYKCPTCGLGFVNNLGYCLQCQKTIPKEDLDRMDRKTPKPEPKKCKFSKEQIASSLHFRAIFRVSNVAESLWVQIEKREEHYLYGFITEVPIALRTLTQGDMVKVPHSALLELK